MNGSTTIDTRIINIETGETKPLTQTITLTDNDDLVYTVEGGEHKIVVDAKEYVGKLRELTGL